MTYDSTSTDPAQRAQQAIGAARNIKYMIVTAPERYDTPQFRLALRDMVFMARMLNQQSIRDRKAQ